MADYISRESAVKVLTSIGTQVSDSRRRAVAKCINEIELLHAADVEPVVHGRWDEVDWVEMESGGHELIRTPNAALRCSNCHNCFKKELLWKNSYCPNCGAKMDGGAEDG